MEPEAVKKKTENSWDTHAAEGWWLSEGEEESDGEDDPSRGIFLILM